MTETDNPKVKKHIEPDEDHTDEFLRTIEKLYVNERNNRNMFANRSIQPVISVGILNDTTKKYEPVQGKPVLFKYIVSAADYTMTCPANTKRKISFHSIINETHPTTYYLELTRGSVTEYLLASLTQAPAFGVSVLVGSPITIATGAALEPALSAPIVLYPGDSLKTTMVNYVALDVTHYVYDYEDVSI